MKKIVSFLAPYIIKVYFIYIILIMFIGLFGGTFLFFYSLSGPNEYISLLINPTGILFMLLFIITLLLPNTLGTIEDKKIQWHGLSHILVTIIFIFSFFM